MNCSPSAGRSAWLRLPQALLYVTLLIPSHLYELLPIAVLIGTIFVMARLAQSSEYTILRTSGLGPWRALRTLLLLGLGFVMLTFAVGDYVAPSPTGRRSCSRRASRTLYSLVGNTGAWLKERQGDNSFAVNVATMERNGTLKDPRIFEFDDEGFIMSQVDRRFGARRRRSLDAGRRRAPGIRHPRRRQARIVTTKIPMLEWPTSLTPKWCRSPCFARNACARSTCSTTSTTSTPTARPRSATRSSSGARCSIRCRAW